MGEPQIYCPKCKWRPTGTSRWLCSSRMGGCGHVWNTFLTGGLCPSCGCAWEITACLSCKLYSLHKQWYHYPDNPSLHDASDRVKETTVDEIVVEDR